MGPLERAVVLLLEQQFRYAGSLTARADALKALEELKAHLKAMDEGVSPAKLPPGTTV